MFPGEEKGKRLLVRKKKALGGKTGLFTKND